jgi:hypothetical protein
MNKNESKVQSLLEKNFDEVIRPEKGTYQWNSLKELYNLGWKLSQEMGYLRNVKLDHFIQAGVPDFLAYSYIYDEDRNVQITDYLFVEVKTESGKLSMSQLKWFNRFPKLDAQVVIHDSDNKKVKSFEPPIVNMIS